MSSSRRPYVDLLERPLFGHLGTMRPDGRPQVNVMWFDWDGELLRFTHIPQRQKYRNLQANPRISLSVADPDDGYRYLEVRGLLERIEDDPGGKFYMELVRPLRPPDGPSAAGCRRPDRAGRAPDGHHHALVRRRLLQTVNRSPPRSVVNGVGGHRT